MSEINPAVTRTLEGLSEDMAGAIGAPPPMMNGARPPAPPFVPPPEKPMSPTQQKQVLAEAASPRGFSTLASKRFAQLGPLMPGAEKVRIRKRREDGSVATVKDYNYRDVEQQGDVEGFVQAYLYPKLGGGDYEVYLIDATGKEYNAGIVRLWGAPRDPDAEAKAAPPPDPAAGMMPLMVEMYRRSTTPGPDPFSQMRQMKEFLAMDKPTDNNPIIAMMQMQAQQSQQQMQMQMQLAQQQQASMMAMFAQKPQDDRLLQMLERFDRRLEAIEKAPPPPPPSMMPAPSGPNTAELLTAIGGLAASIVPLIKGDGVKATEMASLIIQAQQAARPTDSLGVRDVISIFQDKEARQSPPATLEEQIGTLIRVKEIAGALAPAPQGPQGTTFWDALVTLFGNGDFAKAIGSRVDQGMQPKQVEITSNRSVPTQQPQLTDQASPPQQPAQEEPAVQMPPDFPAKCKAIEDAVAVGPGAQIEATVGALMSLQPIPKWQPFLQSFLHVTAKGDKEDAKRHLGSWFKLLMENKMLSREAALATLKTFDMAFPMVREGLLDRLPALRAVAQAADAERAQAAAAVPVQAQPAVQPEEVPVAAAPAPEAPVEIPVPTGPAPVHVDIGDADAAAYSSQSL